MLSCVAQLALAAWLNWLSLIAVVAVCGALGMLWQRRAAAAANDQALVERAAATSESVAAQLQTVQALPAPVALVRILINFFQLIGVAGVFRVQVCVCRGNSGCVVFCVLTHALVAGPCGVPGAGRSE